MTTEKASERCRRTGFQACSHCDDTGCCDNQSTRGAAAAITAAAGGSNSSAGPLDQAKKCRRCGADEWRQDGYCSCECQDLHEVEQERDDLRTQLAAAEARAKHAEAVAEHREKCRRALEDKIAAFAHPDPSQARGENDQSTKAEPECLACGHPRARHDSISCRDCTCGSTEKRVTRDELIAALRGATEIHEVAVNTGFAYCQGCYGPSDDYRAWRKRVSDLLARIDGGGE